MRDDRIDTIDYVADVSFACPRCAVDVTERLYGPCEQCRDLMQAAQQGGPDVDVVTVEYEPKINVTPNAVALKDD